MENIDGCSICLEQDNQFQKWNCQHRFHENCANLWSNGCPICRTMELVNEEHVTVTWSISRNPGNVLDLERMKNTNILHENVEHIYKNIWLNRNESSLTIPVEIKLKNPAQNNSIIFTYFMSPNVELKYRFE